MNELQRLRLRIALLELRQYHPMLEQNKAAITKIQTRIDVIDDAVRALREIRLWDGQRT